MAEIKGNSVGIEISADNTVWKTLICETESGFQLSRETTTAPRTKCDGPAAGQRVILQGYTSSMDFDAVVDDAPTSSQVTYADMQGYFLAGTLLYVRQQNASSDAAVYQSVQAYLTELSSAHPEEGFVTFSGTFTGHGDVDVTQA